MKKVVVSIINYNNSIDTKECLRSLSNIKTHGIELEVIVIDNASSSPFIHDFDEYKSLNLSLIRNSTNLGFSGGHNISIKHALLGSADYILILNNDTKVDKNFLLAMLDTFKMNNNVCAVVPKIYFFKGYEFHADKYKESEKGHVLWYTGGYMDWDNIIGKNRGVDEVDKGQYDKTEVTELATGCCMLIETESLRKIGNFDEKYFLYYEDTDFSVRARNSGYKIVYQPDALMWHKNAGSAGGSGSELQDYYITRNRLLFGQKFGTLRTKFALIRESLKLISTGRKWQKKGILDYYFRKFGKGSYNG